MNSNVRLADFRSGPAGSEFEYSGQPPEQKFLNLKDLIAIGRRRLRFIVCFVVLCTAATVLVTLILPKSYSGVATVVLERNDSRPYLSTSAGDTRSVERDGMAAETEMAVLTSRAFLGRVVDAFSLTNDPRYNSYLPTPAKPDADKTIGDQIQDGVNWTKITVADTLRDNFGINLWPKTKKVIPPFDVQRDSAINNLAGQLTVSRTGNSLALSIKITTNDPDLAAKLANGVADQYVSSSLEVKSQPALNADLINIQSNQAYLNTLRNEEARLLQERASLQNSLGDNHPKVLHTDASIESVRRMIQQEISRVSADLQNEAKRPGANVVSKASVPTAPTFPKMSIMLAVSSVGSLMVAIALAFLLESADKRIRSNERTVRVSGYPHLGYVPLIPRFGFGRKQRPMRYMRRRPRSAFVEAVRSLFIACRAEKSLKPHQNIMVTSCLPDEGKTSLSLGLAVMAVKDELKTIIVDLDFHRPGIFNALGVNGAGHSLERFLSGEAELPDAIYNCVKIPGLDVLALERPLDGFARLSSNKLQMIVEYLRANYDVVIFDTPPVLVVDDASWLSPFVDAVLLVVRWGKTTEDALADASTHLRMSNAPVLGTIINHVDPQIQARHGYGGPPQYYRQASKYVVN